MITQDELVAVIRNGVKAAGSQKNLAIMHSISPGYLSDVLCGRREISAQLAGKFGYRKVVTFHKHRQTKGGRK